MSDKKFPFERQSAFAARFEAQTSAFGLVVFQRVRDDIGYCHSLLSLGVAGV